VQVIPVPGSLDLQTVDALLDLVPPAETGRRLLFDARHVRWVDPNGMVGLLVAGTVARERSDTLPRLELPESPDVLSYLGRMAFFEQIAGVFEIDARSPRRAGTSSDVLLEITAVRANADVHDVVDRVQSRAGAILSSKLGYPATSVVQFSVILSEVCQNIIEHADGPGWVAAQAYNWARRLGRWVVVISVMDIGRGFRGSLAEEHRAPGERGGSVVTDLPLDPIAIDVGDLLQRTVASLYSHLVTRPTGRAVRMAIETQLAEAGGRSLSLIDLSEVTILDFSCADEVVAKLLQTRQGDAGLEALFVFRGVHEPHRDQIQIVLERQSLAVVAETGPGRFELLGARSADEDVAWCYLEEEGFLAREEAHALPGPEDPAGAFESLSDRGLAFKSPVTGRYHALSRLVQHLT
jgi:anti-anti-sigma regulatory factor/anti-sigma regulatory factor (Ser/Thr protein kinase)